MARDYYNSLILKPNGWVKISKTKSAFVTAELPELSAVLDAEAQVSEKKPAPPTEVRLPEYDRKGRLIDRNPPTDGICERKRSDGTIEYWCPICNRWGSHLELGHARWQEQMRKNREAWLKKKEEAKAAEGESTQTAPSMQRATVTICKPVA